MICNYSKCKLTIFHWHCNFCKEIITGWWSDRRINCNLCARENTARKKLSTVKKAIKNEISNYNYNDEDEIKNILKSKTRVIYNKSKSFHGSNQDIEQIIDNYFDKLKPLPLISVNGCGGRINLNNSRKKKEFDNKNKNYLMLIKENNRENIYINCHYNDKDECKILGGKWDKNKKSWYIPKGIDRTKFKKWL